MQSHDLGALGAAFNTRAAERQLEILKEMGCNAIRTSHNPPAPELVDLCDKMGFLMEVELSDTWKNGRNQKIIMLILTPGMLRISKQWYAATATTLRYSSGVLAMKYPISIISILHHHLPQL